MFQIYKTQGKVDPGIPGSQGATYTMPCDILVTYRFIDNPGRPLAVFYQLQPK